MVNASLIPPGMIWTLFVQTWLQGLKTALYSVQQKIRLIESRFSTNIVGAIAIASLYTNWQQISFYQQFGFVSEPGTNIAK